LNEYSMLLPAAASTSPPWAGRSGHEPSVQVPGVLLLGVRVTAYVFVNETEHRRREDAGIGAVTDPALLDRLLDLPVDAAVSDPAIWAEMTGQEPGIAERGEVGTSVTRHLVPPLAIKDVVVSATGGRELGVVQDVSLLAGFTRRWVAATRSRIPDAAVLEAQLCGVGVLDRCGRVLFPAEKPVCPTMDGWSWLLQEKVYRRWLSQQAQVHATASPERATGAANVA
jgi:hypothetical protein